MKKHVVSGFCILAALCLCLSGILPGEGVSVAWAEAAGRWAETADGWMYMEDAGAATGWREIGGVWYWFDASGIMAQGWREINGVWYWFDASGSMAEGWKEIEGVWYYLKDGAMQTGWLELDGTWYYFAQSGAMVTGQQEIDGKVYFFDESGAWKENGGEITLFGAPWRAACSEVVSAVAGNFALEVSGRANKIWFKEDSFLSTGSIDYHDEMGFFAYCRPDSEKGVVLYGGYPLSEITYYFLHTPDESGNALVHDTDHSMLVYAEAVFEKTEDIDQLYSNVLGQLTAEYGDPVDHKESTDITGSVSKRDYWAGANGTRMVLYLRDQSDLVLRCTFDGVDALLEEAHNLENVAATVAADGRMHLGDGMPKALEGFSVTPGRNMYYEINPLPEDADVTATLHYATVGLLEDGNWTGDQLVIFKGNVFMTIAGVHEALGDFIRDDLQVNMLRDSSSLYTSFRDGTFAEKDCLVYDDSAWRFEVGEGDGPYGYFFRVLTPKSMLHEYYFVIMTVDSADRLDAVEKEFEGIVNW